MPLKLIENGKPAIPVYASMSDDKTGMIKILEPAFKPIHDALNGADPDFWQVLSAIQLRSHSKHLGFESIGQLRSYIEEKMFAQLVSEGFGVTFD